MQLLQGQTLRQRIESSAPGQPAFSRQELLDVASQIVVALDTAHQKGIIHRDIKPANIFLTHRGEVKLLDFGLAKRVDTGGDPGESLSLNPRVTGRQEHVSATDASQLGLTLTGATLGTASYMSPEQVRKEPVDARSDLFSFGAVFYEMATGRQAFCGESQDLIHDAILNHTPPSPLVWNPDLPAKLESVITRALEKDRLKRYQTAAEMGGDLKQLANTRQHGKLRSALVRHWMLSAVAGLMVIALVASALYWHSHRTHKLAERDTIVLADFANSTGDAVFDGTLKQALALQLDQSPFLNVLSDQKVNDTLRLMNHRVAEHLTEGTAQEVCTRVNGRAVLTGSIAPRGDGYRIDLRTLDCQSGDALATAEAESTDRYKVLNALDEAATHLRQKLGESLGSVHNFNKPLEQATTSSLEALQAYTQGRKKQAEQGEAAAISYFKLAVDLDPNFAYAYVARGTSYFGLFEFKQAAADIQKAFDLRDRVTQRERFAIEGYYYDWVTGEQEKMRASHMEWARTYPRDYIPHVRLSAYYRFTGQFEKAVSEARKAFDLAPDNTVSAYYLMMAEFRSNHFDQAKAVLNEAQARKLDSPMLRLGRYLVAFQEHDNKTMEDLVKSSANTPLAADLLLMIHSETQAYYGRFKLASQLSDAAADMARNAAAPERAAFRKLDEAERNCEVGFPGSARRFADEGLSLSTSLDVSAEAALVFALSGDLGRAKKMADQLAQEHPLDTAVQYYSLPVVRAAIALQKNKPNEALDELRAALPYELGGASICCVEPPYLRGLAYLQAGNGKQAAEEFQKLLDHPGVVEVQVKGALAHLQLGRAEAMRGDKAAARKAYQDFLTLWKDADPDIPIYQQAKVEYAKLQ
jgi:tetratricopeptide (TPR) repeat protein